MQGLERRRRGSCDTRRTWILRRNARPAHARTALRGLAAIRLRLVGASCPDARGTTLGFRKIHARWVYIWHRVRSHWVHGSRQSSKALVILSVALALGGCAGGSALHATADELPVACVVKPDPGPCGGSEVRYFYDYRDDRCKPFRYGGCGGSAPFQTLQGCLDFCGARP
jgi:hypothetical protein